jgi:enoyl-CoA hydratase
MTVDLEQRGAVAVVTMNRPAALNAFDTDQLRRMLDRFAAIRADRDVRCVVLTGAGDRAFAAGADIKEMANLSPSEGLAFGRLGHALTRDIEGLPQPVIAAVNGLALGGGCEVALAADIRLASESAQFAQPEVTLGIPPGWGGTQRLPRLVGAGIAAELIFTGRRVAAREALQYRLVNAVYPADRLLPEAMALAERIAAASPSAVRTAKRLLALSFAGDPAAQLATELTLFGESFGTPDQREGMTAFVEKRSASFSGS